MASAAADCRASVALPASDERCGSAVVAALCSCVPRNTKASLLPVQRPAPGLGGGWGVGWTYGPRRLRDAPKYPRGCRKCRTHLCGSVPHPVGVPLRRHGCTGADGTAAAKNRPRALLRWRSSLKVQCRHGVLTCMECCYFAFSYCIIVSPSENWDTVMSEDQASSWASTSSEVAVVRAAKELSTSWGLTGRLSTFSPAFSWFPARGDSACRGRNLATPCHTHGFVSLLVWVSELPSLCRSQQRRPLHFADAHVTGVAADRRLAPGNEPRATQLWNCGGSPVGWEEVSWFPWLWLLRPALTRPKKLPSKLLPKSGHRRNAEAPLLQSASERLAGSLDCL